MAHLPLHLCSHHPSYRDTYAANLRRELPRIPPEIFAYKLGNRSALDWVIDERTCRGVALCHWAKQVAEENCRFHLVKNQHNQYEKRYSQYVLNRG